MSQILIIPLNKAQLTAGYKNANYRKKFGFTHYGFDLSNGANDDRTLWGMGDGVVKAVGFDKVFGNVVVMVYEDVLIPGTQKVQDLTVRLYHLASTAVVVGQKITTATKLGVMGNTGQYSTGPHVHVEIDTDTNMPTYAPGLSKSSNIIKKCVDSTLSPAKVLAYKASPPDKQTIEFAAGVYADRAEAQLPEYSAVSTQFKVEAGPMSKELAEALAKQIKAPGYSVAVKEW